MTTPTDGKVQVLVVDDDSDTEFICKSLSTDRHQIEVSDRAADGLERLNQTDSYDMVVVDYRLDEGTAIDFIAKAKQIRPDIPYLVWSVSSIDNIKKEMHSFELTVFETGIAGFRQKRDVQANPGLMATFLEEAATYYRQQVYNHLKPELVKAFGQLEIALNHTRQVTRSINSITSSNSDLLTGPVEFRLNHIEAILRQLLGYSWKDDPEERSKARSALEEIISQNTLNPVPTEVHASLAQFVRHWDGRPNNRSAVRLSKALTSWSSTEPHQRAIASRTAELVEFLIYSGDREQAKTLSAEVWQHANGNWSEAAKLSCGITHGFALAAAGSPSLAEHLIAGILLEAETVYPKQSYDELARSVFAEFEHLASEARIG
ncbi:response regulator [Novosphingobium album (ex Liu et al. 2023)]|uniref:Response regulator n=1 Tax=Novosphingobium album (ex Liu et al. 2023) TaxID=3031130 RepID=A0ABT5WXK8_9SPHN|nr:response regulator [Novosphingobium album (ex Liu et al. 2023)]MDE8654619.1 response regulator [Novosphingobium album (ex Liu et al. 2023)]